MPSEEVTLHSVADGECLQSISAAAGLSWETVWEHGANDALRELRRDPDALLPGDELAVPDIVTKDVDSGTEERHTFRRKGVPAMLRLTFQIEEEPRSDEPFIARIDGKVEEGTLDGDGKLELPIRPAARRAEIWVGEDEEPYVVSLGRLAPVETVLGALQRLANLGLCDQVNAGQDPEALSESLVPVLMQFQAEEELEVTGELDEETTNRLAERHRDAGE